MPFCHVHLVGRRVKSKAYPKELKTIGDHIRKRRLDLGIFQKQVAEIIGVETTTICNWESNAFEPATRFMPAIIHFLGYNPLPEADTLIEKFTRIRKSLGLTQEELAQKLGVDESTIAHWEQGKNTPDGPYRKLMEEFVGWNGTMPNAETSPVLGGRSWPGKLITARKSLGLSRAALARKLGISVHTMWRWERGDRRPGGLYRKLVDNLIRGRIDDKKTDSG